MAIKKLIMHRPGTFGYDREFLEKHIQLIVLENKDSRLIVSPDLQGRVITSTAKGEKGRSFGWINYNLIESRCFVPHCNNFGGEDRFWIGPEGGQYSIFFKKGKAFDLENWQTPPAIDTEKWEIDSVSSNHAFFRKVMILQNYSGFTFDLLAEREVRLLDSSDILKNLDLQVGSNVKSVGFTSVNKITNTGNLPWKKETGLLSVWILGQFIPSGRNTVILPFSKDGKGPVVNDSYFGKIDDDRIKILENAVLFKGDGKKRGKIGLPPGRALPVIGSFDPVNQVLTIVKYALDGENQDYVNSMWELQESPFSGDVVNSYNDGPLPDGSVMGPFYELETSSPAVGLAPGKTITHEHTSFHFTGTFRQLQQVAINVLGVSLENCF